MISCCVPALLLSSSSCYFVDIFECLSPVPLFCSQASTAIASGLPLQIPSVSLSDGSTQPSLTQPSQQGGGEQKHNVHHAFMCMRALFVKKGNARLSHVFLTSFQALSTVGRCKTFDVSADGYGRGEGVGLMFLAASAGGEQMLPTLAVLQVRNGQIDSAAGQAVPDVIIAFCKCTLTARPESDACCACVPFPTLAGWNACHLSIYSVSIRPHLL